MRRVSAASLVLALGLTPGCRGNNDEPPHHLADRSELARPDPDAPPADTQRSSAAGVGLWLPSSWTLVEEAEPDFALAWGPSNEPSQQSLCTIELRRQGPGPLPAGAQPSPSSSVDASDYTHGPVRGRLRELPGPTPSAVVLVHCRAHRATGQWGAIETAFKSMRAPASPPQLPPLEDQHDNTIVDLCVASPTPQAMVCARRADGAVYCGPRTSDTLTRVEGLPPALQLSCDPARSCIRDRDGQVSCWTPKQAPEQLPGLTSVRDIAGNCVVDAGGHVLCHPHHQLDLAELVPFADPAHALTEVERVLAGSDEDQGCVLRRVDADTQLWCWDLTQELPLELREPGHPQKIAAAAKGDALAWIGGRVCVGTGGQWTCLDGAQRFELDSCERRACGCSLVGATRLSCDHEPHHRLDSRVFGRVSEVVAVMGPCAARRNGTVVCRGPVAGRRGDDARANEVVAGGVPGAAHVLDLRDP